MFNIATSFNKDEYVNKDGVRICPSETLLIKFI
jgi:hypothetical protein